ATRLSSFHRQNFPGKYRSDNSEVSDTLRLKLAERQIDVELDGDPKAFGKSQFEAKLVSDRVARFESIEKGKASERASLYLFNSGIFVHLEDLITQTEFSAIYYP